MAEGRLAYIGDLARAPEFFALQGYVCPSNYNPADFYIKTLAISPASREECKERVQLICDGFQSSTFASELSSDILLDADKSNNLNAARKIVNNNENTLR